MWFLFEVGKCFHSKVMVFYISSSLVTVGTLSVNISNEIRKLHLSQILNCTEDNIKHLCESNSMNLRYVLIECPPRESNYFTIYTSHILDCPA